MSQSSEETLLGTLRPLGPPPAKSPHNRGIPRRWRAESRLAVFAEAAQRPTTAYWTCCRAADEVNWI
jgi:hypothetical protein